MCMQILDAALQRIPVYWLYSWCGCRRLHFLLLRLFSAVSHFVCISYDAEPFVGITWHHFLLHGVQFSRTRASSSLASGAYIRLVSMAVSEVTCTIAATLVTMVFNLSSGLAPWADFKRDWTKILSFSSAATPRSTTAMLVTEWAIVIAQCIFFIGLFVLGDEGRSRLHEALEIVRRAFTFPEKRSTCPISEWYVACCSVSFVNFC
jgi:pheromone a factor receptor